MGQINVEPGMLVYCTRDPHELNPGEDHLNVIIGEYAGPDAEDQKTADGMTSSDLAYLRTRLVNALTCVENTMEARGFFKRYTTKDQD